MGRSCSGRHLGRADRASPSRCRSGTSGSWSSPATTSIGRCQRVADDLDDPPDTIGSNHGDVSGVGDVPVGDTLTIGRHDRLTVPGRSSREELVRIGAVRIHHPQPAAPALVPILVEDLVAVRGVRRPLKLRSIAPGTSGSASLRTFVPSGSIANKPHLPSMRARYMSWPASGGRNLTWSIAVSGGDGPGRPVVHVDNRVGW